MGVSGVSDILSTQPKQKKIGAVLKTAFFQLRLLKSLPPSETLGRDADVYIAFLDSVFFWLPLTAPAVLTAV